MNNADYPGAHAEPGVEIYYFEFPIGSTGAVGTVVRSRGLGTPVRNGTGDYSIPLSGGVQAILGSHIELQVAAPAVTDAHIIRPKLETVSGSAPLFRFETWTQGVPSTSTDGAVANPPSGSTLKGFIVVKNSNA